MKVAISAQGSQIDSLVDPRFGRAAWFIIADPNSLRWSALDNAENTDSCGGAGTQATTLVTGHAVEAVITGNVGPNALKMLAAAGIRCRLPLVLSSATTIH